MIQLLGMLFRHHSKAAKVVRVTTATQRPVASAAARAGARHSHRVARPAARTFARMGTMAVTRNGHGYKVAGAMVRNWNKLT